MGGQKTLGYFGFGLFPAWGCWRCCAKAISLRFRRLQSFEPAVFIVLDPNHTMPITKPPKQPSNRPAVSGPFRGADFVAWRVACGEGSGRRQRNALSVRCSGRRKESCQRADQQRPPAHPPLPRRFVPWPQNSGPHSMLLLRFKISDMLPRTWLGKTSGPLIQQALNAPNWQSPILPRSNQRLQASIAATMCER